MPVVISGFTGSFTVIAVNGWMNSPEGFDLALRGHAATINEARGLGALFALSSVLIG